jgi:hypothetical protein
MTFYVIILGDNNNYVYQDFVDEGKGLVSNPALSRLFDLSGV